MLDVDVTFGSLAASALFILVCFLFYRYSTQNSDYWAKRNVKFVKLVPFVGSVYEFTKRPIHEVDEERYKKYGNLCGTFEGTLPVLMVGDPDLLRDILLKDFNMFPNRRPVPSSDPLMEKIVVFTTGEDWKRIRSIITPTFSTGKIKKMMGIFKECSQTAVENFKKAGQNGEVVDLKRILGGFTMDVIASSAFSTKLDSHNDPENEFVRMASMITKPKINWRALMYLLFPNFVKPLGITIFPKGEINFFRDVILDIIAQRKKTGQTRNDFLQMLLDTAKESSEVQKLELKEKEGEDVASSYGGVSTDHQVFKNVSKKDLTINELVGQCILFFIAGFDATASVLSFVIYNLAVHQDVQEKVHKELVEVLAATNGEVTYEVLQNMTYLDNVISETLRLYPTVIRAERQAAADYKLGDTGITIPKGMILNIPIYAIHRDPKYYSDPDSFNPDRFTPEEKSKRNQYAYIPFGAGPRNCIGMRFALIEIKVCVSYIITNFKVNKCPKTKVPLEFLKGQATLQPKEVYVSLELRRNISVLK